MNLKISISVAGLLLAISSCGPYSFTGVSTTAQTITIDNFYNNTNLGPANLNQTFTNELKDYFLQNSSLSIVPAGGELQLSGVISGYRVTQVAPTASRDPNEQGTAALSRLTITISATYVNAVDELLSFENKSFSFYADFDNSQNLTDVEDRLIQDIFDQIVLDIFNASVANW